LLAARAAGRGHWAFRKSAIHSPLRTWETSSQRDPRVALHPPRHAERGQCPRFSASASAAV